ncbi:MAG TPA: hypothetical protein VK473_09745 [Terriglobales bacterium]|nr:hypothetical protein [Terriglobales bacterium]
MLTGLKSIKKWVGLALLGAVLSLSGAAFAEDHDRDWDHRARVHDRDDWQNRRDHDDWRKDRDYRDRNYWRDHDRDDWRWRQQYWERYHVWPR